MSRAPGSEATEVDKGHGRIEKRTVRTTPILTADGWPGLTLGIEIRRERTVKGETTVEVGYAITSWSTDAATLLQVIRDHWRMENSLHWVRDVTLGEDACRVRSGSAPQVLASLRNAVVYVLSGVKAESRVAAIERMQARPDEAKTLIGLK